MTTHVFIVDETTFKYHLEYLFAGTGAGNKDVDFNDSKTTQLHHSTENGLVAMMADGCRVRKNDLIIFYLQATKKHEGMFYGIFQAVSDGIFLDRNNNRQFLHKELKKSLTFRLEIRPYEVYAKGITEWSALDEIKNIKSPNQMLWSLIYRKLKGNRGNTMITIYESEHLIGLIQKKNDLQQLDTKNKGLTYNNKTFEIETASEKKEYLGRREEIKILPRLISKYSNKRAHEVHLQMYITQYVGRGINKSLDKVLNINTNNIEWLGNEVSCGVGLQRIDVMISKVESETKRILFPIELKAVPAYEDNTRQLKRYIDWIEQYYIPNRESIIQPVLICKKQNPLSQELKNNFLEFNKQKGLLPLKYIEYSVKNSDLYFEQVDYTK